MSLFNEGHSNTLMKNHLNQWLSMTGIELTPVQMSLSILAIIAVISIIIHLFFHQVLIKLITKFAKGSKRNWRVLIDGKFLSRLALAAQGVILNIQAALWLNHASVFYPVIKNVTILWSVVWFSMTMFALVDAFAYLTKMNKRTKNLPIQGLLQAAKLFISILAIIVIVAVIINRSPMLVISGLGAMTAVLMFVFKDPIMGFMAGIQLSVNDMLRIGDWLEMPTYGADGDVIEIGLTTVKVQNWDKTITTIPTYALITDSFKNWQGMSQSGGRRIKRSVFIDVSSIKFIDKNLLNKLNSASLLTDYLAEKTSEIDAFNKDNKINLEMKVNGRRLTNIGTFRAYLLSYLKNHPGIHNDMTLIVRQMEAENNGIPLQIYAFTNTTAWIAYEKIQSDIFDHIYAIVDAFELRVHQSPGSADFLMLGQQLSGSYEK